MPIFSTVISIYYHYLPTCPFKAHHDDIGTNMLIPVLDLLLAFRIKKDFVFYAIEATQSIGPPNMKHHAIVDAYGGRLYRLEHC